jgi:hypothetical protein
MIPPEYLFGGLGFLVSIVYWDLKRGQIEQQKAGTRRDIILGRICERLGIRWGG